jgi:hypothetical protein
MREAQMSNNESSTPKDKERFSFCPQCGRKGMYHIKLQYHRCRYCGTYVIAPEKKEDNKTDLSVVPVTG